MSAPLTAIVIFRALPFASCFIFISSYTMEDSTFALETTFLFKLLISK